MYLSVRLYDWPKSLICFQYGNSLFSKLVATTEKDLQKIIILRTFWKSIGQRDFKLYTVCWFCMKIHTKFCVQWFITWYEWMRLKLNRTFSSRMPPKNVKSFHNRDFFETSIKRLVPWDVFEGKNAINLRNGYLFFPMNFKNYLSILNRNSLILKIEILYLQLRDWEKKI